MNIAIIAANGRSGKLFVERALSAGHTVRAGVYGAHDFSPSEQLTVVECDATKMADIVRLLEGADAVVSFIGHVKGSPAHVQTEAMNILVAAMRQSNVRRVVSLTGTGVRFPEDRITLVDRVLNLSINVIDPARVRDGKDHAEVLRSSDLDWTIIRVLKLQNVAKRPFALRPHGPTKWYVGREEVAEAVLQVLEEGTFVGEAPIICR